MTVGHRSSLAFGLQLQHQLFLGLKAIGFQTATYTTMLLVVKPSDLGGNDTVSSPGPSARQLQVLGK